MHKADKQAKEITKKKISFLKTFLLFLYPNLLQALYLAIVIALDPCIGKQNAGCLAGSFTTFAMILSVAAMFLVLLIAVLIEMQIRNLRFIRALKINLALATIPFVLILALLVFARFYY